MADRCDNCGASIRWARTMYGRNLPLDAAPVPTGNVYIATNAAGERTAVIMGGHDTPPANVTERFTAHFATCPNAAEHRTRKAKAPR